MNIKKTFKETHPWLTFSLDFRRFDPGLWMALGMCASKCDHISNVSLQPAISINMMKVALIKGAQATTAIEGNTLTEAEVREVLEKGPQAIPPSREYMAEEVMNILEALQTIWDEPVPEQSGIITVEMIKAWHARVLRGIEVQDHVQPGEYRQCSVGAGSYRGAPHEDIPYLMETCCQTLNNFPRLPGHPLAAALTKAIFAHLYLAWIHPFGDGNGRTARLIEFFFLADAGCPQPAAHILSDHYNLTRSRYYRMLDAARRSEDDVVGFIRYAVEGYLDGLNDRISQIHTQQFLVAWESFVHQVFREKSGESDRRQRDLLLALPRDGSLVAVADLAGLTPKLAAQYAKRTPKTLTRDVNALKATGLLIKEGHKVRPRVEVMLGFLPKRKTPEA